MEYLKNIKIGQKLLLGFGIISLLLAVIVFTAIIKVSNTEGITSRVIELRAPTAKLGVELLNGLNYSLANLRGYMLLGKNEFKKSREDAWNKQINPSLEKMLVLSENWSVEGSKTKLKKMISLFKELQTAQEEIENISGTLENLPAQKTLVEQAAPKAEIMANSITAMIEHEKKLEATVGRKALLAIMADIRGSLGLGIANIRAYLLTGDEKYKNKFDDFWAINSKRFKDLQKNKYQLTPQQKLEYRKLSEARRIFSPIPPKMFEIRGSEGWNIANLWLGTKAAPLAAEITSNLEGMIKIQEDLMNRDSHLAASSINELNLSLWVIFAIGLIISIFIGITTTKLIKTPLLEINDVAQTISSGDLTKRVNYKSKDEFGELGTAFNEMVDNIQIANDAVRKEKAAVEQKVKEAVAESEKNSEYLSRSTNQLLGAMTKFANGDLTVSVNSEIKDDDIGQLFDGFNTAVKNIKNMIEQVMDSVKATASATSEISSSSEQMAAGAQEQSAQATEIAGAVEEMSATILETTKNAGIAAKSAKEAGVIANDGGTVVNETVVGMNRIAEVVSEAAIAVKELGTNSNKIGEIIQVIDDIADQTNLLALNAAIEAARAGEQGRGFAVVADEVRKLAERTTKATKEIAGMIKEIQKDTGGVITSIEQGAIEVEKGKDLAAKAGASMEDIVSSTNKVVDVINQVAAASEEQASASEQISLNIEGINTVTHQSAAGVQEIAKSSENLNKLTKNLISVISQFKTGKESSSTKEVSEDVLISNYHVSDNGSFTKDNNLLT